MYRDRNFRNAAFKRMVNRAILAESLIYRSHPLEQEDLTIVAKKRANHLKGCSCHMCGNPRKYFNDLTLQERAAAISMEEGIEEWRAHRNH